MLKILRIVCCIISAAILASAVFIFVFLGWMWGLISLGGALIFFILTLLFKGMQEDKERKDSDRDDRFI